MALVPEVAVPTLWQNIKENRPEVISALTPSLMFIEYFAKYYINGPFAGIWSHYDTKGAKTNNHVEAYKITLKKFVNYKTNLNIFVSIELFQSQKLFSWRKMVEIDLDKPNRLKQDPSVRARNDTYNSLKRLWEDGSITINVFSKPLFLFIK